MIEITKVIESFDVPTSTIIYEVCVFKLRNSIAETLGPVLEEALTAATATTQAVQAQGQAQATPARATPPAINLQFLRNSPEGQRMIPEWTGLTPLARLGEVTDLQGAVVFLAAPVSDFVTGHDLVVDGGYTAW